MALIPIVELFLPDVKSAYATIFSEESHRVAVGSVAGSSQRNQASAFVSNEPNSQNFQRNEQMATLISLIKDNKVRKNVQANMAGANQHMTYTDKEALRICHWWNLNWTEISSFAEWNSWFASIRMSGKLKMLLEGVLCLGSCKTSCKSPTATSSNFNTPSFPVKNYGNDADSSDEFAATQNEEVATLKENVVSEGSLDQNPSSSHGVQNAPTQWNAKLTSTLIENGFSQSKSDYSLYTKSNKGVFLALLVYVDDIIITGNSIYKIEKFKVFLKSKFIIKDLGKLKYFLEIEVVDTDKGICLIQIKYVLDLLSEYGMLACKPAKTPLMSKFVISNEASKNDPLLENVTDYQKLIGKLIYLTNTRPDISYDVHCLSQFMHSPLSSHLKIAFKILRYLKRCPENLLLAEYRALVSVTSEVIWILKFLKDLQIENLLPVSLHCDSNSAIKIAANPVFHEI
ncbi:ribonuclease H-like domain-containing protein [Tanacetum coccineum]